MSNSSFGPSRGLCARNAVQFSASPASALYSKLTRRDGDRGGDLRTVQAVVCMDEVGAAELVLAVLGLGGHFEDRLFVAREGDVSRM